MDEPVTHLRYVLVPESLEYLQFDLGLSLRSHIHIVRPHMLDQLYNGISPEELRRVLGIEEGFCLSNVFVLRTDSTPELLNRVCQHGITALPYCSLSNVVPTFWRSAFAHPPNAYIAA